MKGKIIVVLICMMLLTTFFAVATNIEKIETENKENDIQQLSFDEVDVPIWEVGDSWTFNIADMEFVIDNENLSENLTIIINAQIGDLVLIVTDDSGDTYEVEIDQTPIEGDFYIETDLGDGPVKISGTLEDMSLFGILYFNKEDLGITQFEGFIGGDLIVNIEEQPYFDRSIFPKIPIPVAITIEIGMETPFPVIQFPLNSTFGIWGVPALNASIGGTVESIWLNIFDFINQKVRKWGLIGPVSNFLGVDEQSIQDVSDMIDDILPIIDIEYVINEYLGVDNVFSTPEIPFMFFCNDTVEITVPAGTFECFEIMVAGGIGTIYYSPEVKNIIKMEGNFGDALPFLNGIDAELMSYT